MRTLLTKSVRKAASVIRRSGTVAFPTETVYGLGANVFDEKAIEKIFKFKKRPSDNPLIVHISDKRQIEFLSEKVREIAKRLISRFFPGPLTIILKKNEIIPDTVTAGLDTIAIRMPSSELARKFIKESGVPIAAPSANLSGSPSPTTYRHVIEDFKGKIPCILIGPDAKYGLESTVVDCTSGIPTVLRPGVVTLEQLKKVDRRIKLKKGGKLKSPGQRYRHYAPKARVILSSPKSFPHMQETTPAYIGISAPQHKEAFSLVRRCSNAEDYAKRLFSFFRECDRKRIKIIYAEKVPQKGIGLAIMNRLNKAVSH